MRESSVDPVARVLDEVCKNQPHQLPSPEANGLSFCMTLPDKRVVIALRTPDDATAQVRSEHENLADQISRARVLERVKTLIDTGVPFVTSTGIDTQVCVRWSICDPISIDRVSRLIDGRMIEVLAIVNREKTVIASGVGRIPSGTKTGLYFALEGDPCQRLLFPLEITPYDVWGIISPNRYIWRQIRLSSR